MDEHRLEDGRKDSMGSSPKYIKFKGQHIAKFFDDSRIEIGRTDFDVYLGEKGKILIHTEHTRKGLDGTFYKNKIYETVEDLCTDKDLPKELIDKVKLHFGIDDSEEIDL